MMPQDFEPKPGDPVELFEQGYVVQPHPQMPSMAFKQKAGRARVYQLSNERAGVYVALKEFRKLYRMPSLVDSYRNLHHVESFEGLRAAERRIVLPDDPTAQRHPNLQYAMLMPWIHGTTWFDVLGQARKGDYPDLATAIGLCDRFLEVMEGLEEAGLAHTDISPGNVMIGFDPIEVQLVDLEDMYMPGVDAPLQPHSGSSGYSHRSGEATWKPEGDRYAAAVLAAEILILAKPELARKASDEGYFMEHCQKPEGIARFQEARPWLEGVAPEFAKVFERSWYADSLAGCPSISELREPMKELASRPFAPEGPKRVETPIPRRPSAEPKAAGETPLTTPVVDNGVLTRPTKRLIGAGLAVAALLVMAVVVGVWSTTSESNAPEAVTPLGTETSPQAAAEEFTLTSTFNGHSEPVQSVAFSPDGSLLASGGRDETVKLWDPQGRETLRTLSDTGGSIAFSLDGGLLASAGGRDDATVKLWDPRGGETLRTLSDTGSFTAFSPDGTLLAIASRDGTVKLWDPQSGEELQQSFSGHSAPVQSLAFSPDGSLLASGSSDRTVKLWDPLSGEEFRTLSGHPGEVYSVAFSPDGTLLASGGFGNALKLWDPQSGEELQSLRGHSWPVNSVAFSPDGRLLASADRPPPYEDSTVKLWDAQSGEELRTLGGLAGLVHVAFSPDGRLLVSGGYDGSIRLWARAEGG